MERFQVETFYGLGVIAVNDRWHGGTELLLTDDFGNLVDFVASVSIRHEDI